MGKSTPFSSQVLVEYLWCVQLFQALGCSNEGNPGGVVVAEPGLELKFLLFSSPSPHHPHSLLLQDLWPWVLRGLASRVIKIRQFSGRWSLVCSVFLLAGIEGHLEGSHGHECVLIPRYDAIVPKAWSTQTLSNFMASPPWSHARLWIGGQWRLDMDTAITQHIAGDSWLTHSGLPSSTYLPGTV